MTIDILKKEQVPENAYKMVIIALITSQVLWIFFPWYRFYGDAVQIAVIWNGANSILSLRSSMLFSNALDLLYFVTYVGLFFYSRLARSALLFVVLLGVLGSFFQGLAIQSHAEVSLGYLMTLCEGFLLAIVYFSRVARKFES